MPEAIEIHEAPNGDVTVTVYGIKRFTVEHTPDGFECALWYGEEPVYTVTTYDEDVAVPYALTEAGRAVL
jgi:hypothetical protein